MEDKFCKISILLLLIIIIQINILTSVKAQGLTLEEIRTTLLSNPPNTGDPVIREQTILALDEILKNDSSRTSSEVINFYNLMMQKANSEIVHQTVTNGIAIWIMYNHGFIIKTQQVVFAFDLINGYSGWPTLLPEELIREINVLFISHNHADHYSHSIADTVMAYGGFVIVPSENAYMGNIPVGAGDSLMILELNVKAHYGLHSVPSRIYEISTSSGFRIMHTGDNQTSVTLPITDSIDVLLLNAWVNESGLSSAVVGMRNCINVLTPTVMIPEHIQELAHDYNPGSPTSRVPYEWAFEVDDIPLPSLVQVMAWGEQYLHLGQPSGLINNNKYLPTEFTLQQNYPNPFNPSTTIKYSVPELSKVELKLFNLLGEEVVTLVNEEKVPGYYTVEFNAANLPSGVYFYRIQAGDFIQTKKMILMK